MSKRSIVYIDGFNLYYGAIRGGPHKWLDLQKYFRALRTDDEIIAIKYFTATVSGGRQERDQATYLHALSTLSLVSTILGKFKKRERNCGVDACPHTGPRTFQAPEEKRTDVNIGVNLVDDAYQEACDRFVIVSGDSDLVPALNKVKERFPQKQLIVYVPARDGIRGAATELRSVADKNKTLPVQLMAGAHLPSSIPDGRGGLICKPSGW